MTEFNSLREKIAYETKQRQEDYANFEQYLLEAHSAGMDAVNQTEVIPMVVVEHANPLDDASPVVRHYHVSDGVCGFAWVTVKPGNSRFALYVKKNHNWRKPYEGGIQLWISDFGQSMQKKESYAAAYAKVLQSHGINARSGSRMD